MEKERKYSNFSYVNICQKGSSQESISSNRLLSLMKRTEDAIILRFIPLVKHLLPNNKS